MTGGLFSMLAAGGRALRRRPGLVLALYAVQLGLSLLFAFAVARTLGALFTGTSLFARGVDGELVSLLLALEDHGGAVTALVWCGGALALAYGLASFYLTGGLLASLHGGRFGDGAASWFFPFVRAWLLFLAPIAAALLATALGLGLGAARLEELRSVDAWDLLLPPLLGAVPGLLLLAACACASDYARAILVVGEDRSAVRATLAAFRLVFTSPWPILHYLVYVLVWGGVTALYVALTLGAPYAGTGGLLLLVLLRQLTAGLRFAARVATYAGQLELARGWLARKTAR